MENGSWRRVFVPTYLAYAAAHDDPWAILDSDAVNVLQLIFNTVYKGMARHKVKASEAVHYIVSPYYVIN
jgi:hypothetical protein